MNVDELETRVRALENLVAAQAKKLQELDDIESIKKLQKAYGYYVEHMMYDEIVDCFADSPDVVLNWLEGQWLGKDGVKRYFNFTKNTPLNFQHQVMQLAGIVDIEPDGLHARGRWYAFGGIFLPLKEKVVRAFVSGIYEMGYIKENGIWKILSIKWIIPYSCHISEKWKFPEEINLPYYTDQFKGPKPDIPVDKADLRYVTGYIFPFHYKHPVTGKETSENTKNSRLKPVAIP